MYLARSTSSAERLPALVLAIAILGGVAPMASAQMEPEDNVIKAIADAYVRGDFDGDGFDDNPLPPLGTPTIVSLDGNGRLFATTTTFDNGIVLDSVVDLEGGNVGVDENPMRVAGDFGTISIGCDDVTIPVDGFAAGVSEVILQIPLALTAGPSGFAGSSVPIEVELSTEGTITYIEPSVSGFTYSTTLVAQQGAQFDVAQGSFRSDGSRSGDPPFLGVGYFYNFEPATNTATWDMPVTPIVLSIDVPVVPGAMTAETEIEVKQLNEFSIDNFFGSAPFIADGNFLFEYGPNGNQIEEIRSPDPSITVRIPAPEPSVALGLATGAVSALALRRRRRAAGVPGGA